MMARIAFVGLSHLGIVSSIAAAAKGFDVIGFDPDDTLCASLSQGHLPIVESGLPELLAANRARIQFLCDPESLRGSDVVVCSADVPTDAHGASDLSRIRQLLEIVMSRLSPETTLVVLSQVPPGFTRQLADSLTERAVGERFSVLYQVETLIFGRAVERALRPERFIVGCDDPRQPLPESYARLLESFGCPVLRMRYESAELAKLSINLLLISSVTTANALAEVCEAIGADWSEIVPALRLDARIGPQAYVQPGLGISGGNLERDLATVQALAERHGTDAGIIGAWRADSRYRRDWVLRKLHAMVCSQCQSPTIAVWGLAYKPGTHSTKNSPSLALLEALGRCSVNVYDPQAVLPEGAGTGVHQAGSALDACREADALVVMVPWPEFSAVDLARVRGLMRGDVVIDPFAVLDRSVCAELGMRHLRLGAPAAFADSLVPSIILSSLTDHTIVEHDIRGIVCMNSIEAVTHRWEAAQRPSRVVVLGSAGFIGNNLAQQLAAAGIETLGISSAQINLCQPESVGLLQQLVRRDDALVITSALTPDKGRDAQTLMKNLMMGQYLSQFLQAEASCAHVVYLSSDAVYADDESLIREGSHLSPTTFHGLMHVGRERMLSQATAASRIPLLILRPCSVYGPGDTHNGYGPNRFVRSALNERTIVLFGQGEERRDHLFIDDLCGLITRGLTQRSAGALNVATGHAVSFGEVASSIAALCREPVRIDCRPRQTPITHRHFDTSALVRTFPAFSTTPLAEGLAKMFGALDGREATLQRS